MGNGRRAEKNEQSTIVRSASTTVARGLWSVARQTGALAATFLLLTGCGNIEPWVKPYEREALADPIMSFDPNPISTNYIYHVYEAREGARGALGGSGGGCGCL